jgi:hypothetical protein
MQSNASKKGLIPPAEVLTRELDALKLRVIMHERRQDRLHAAPLALEGGGVVEEIAYNEEEEEEAILYDEEIV